MFTGIIECTGKVESIAMDGTNKSFLISSPISNELKEDQSVSHNGVCLTVECISDNTHQVTAIAETLSKTNLNDLCEGDLINIERCLQMNGRLDGHIVQGHVDATAACIEAKEMDGSWQYSFQFPDEFAALVIERGSVCINGISLTAFDVGKNVFSVAIIPYTYNNTNIKSLKAGINVNIEFDIIGKYLSRFRELMG